MNLRVLALSFVLLALPAASLSLDAQQQKDTPVFDQVDLFHQGGNGVNTYRIPALVQTAKGTIIAVADARYDSPHDLPGHIALVMRRSFDEGKSWEAIRTILSVKEGGVGDASLLLDRTTGRIWCFQTYAPPGIGFWNAKPGAVTGPTTLQVHAMYSDDDGASWSAPVDLTPQIKDPSWRAVFATSGADLQLKSGRFLLPLVVRDANGVHHSVDAYSDDHGKTWKVGSFIGDGTDESHTIELKDGTVLQNMRYKKNRAVARSIDGGITFGPITSDPALIDAICNAGITSYRSGKDDVIVFTNAASVKRENLTVKASYDEGHSWPLVRVINPGTSAYSTLIHLRNGNLGVLYERGGPEALERITFAEFNLAWVAQHPQ